MAKKLSVADIKARRIYRCHNCDAKCDDDHELTTCNTTDICLGRIDDSKTTSHYFCSIYCLNFQYRQRTTESIESLLQEHKEDLDNFIGSYKSTIADRNEELSKFILGHIKYFKVVINFLQACLDKKGEYALYELRCKTNKYIGDFLEEHHEIQGHVDRITNMHKIINIIDIELF
jgi:hypothetical protein